MNLIGMIGLLAQVEAAPAAQDQQSLLQLMMNANFVMQLTLLLLIVFSIISWAIIGSKYRQLKQSKQRSAKFFSSFWHAKSIEAIAGKGEARKGPAFNVFKAGIDALREDSSPNGRVGVEREVHRATEQEIEQMEYGVPFLATTGTAAPFIGLFGTVWGILHAFWVIGRTGESSLATVGPHIAGALITTALGLAAAIPAVIFYNYYINKVRLISKDLWNFTDDYVDRIGKEFY
jgi:biopolymer transport protein TolQ